MSFTWSVPSVEEVSPDVRTHEYIINFCIKDGRNKIDVDFPILLFYYKGWNDGRTKRVWKRKNPISNLEEIKACLESGTNIENSIIFNIEVSASEVYEDTIFNDTKVSIKNNNLYIEISSNFCYSKSKLPVETIKGSLIEFINSLIKLDAGLEFT